MERKLNQIGIFDNAEGREFMTEEFEKAFNDTNGIIQENGRVVNRRP